MTRTVEDIARGLEPARPARTIASGERIHVVGAAGSAASASLLLAQAAGATVGGCDSGEPTHYSEAVAAAGIPLAWNHDPRHVVDEAGRAIVDRIAVSVTGIAGPDGGSAAKPVGLTYIAVAGPDEVEVRRFGWSGDRLANKRDSARAALELLIAAAETGGR